MKHRIGLGLAWLLFLLQSLQAQEPAVSAGKIIRYNNFPSSIIPSREVDVWLPPGYTETHRYPVLYLHDGQMLFDAAQTWNKQGWEIDDTIAALLQQELIEPMLVVGIHNTGANRHAEYCPQRALDLLPVLYRDSLNATLREPHPKGYFAGPIQSDNYLRFIVQELKPFIDAHYPTRPGPANTTIGGSSMGGMISWYAVCEYPEIFGAALCLSTHWPILFTLQQNPFPDAMLHYFGNHLPSAQTHRFYFDYGTATLDSLYEPFQQQADEHLRRAGYQRTNWKTQKFPGADHSENAWRNRFRDVLLFQYGTKKQPG